MPRRAPHILIVDDSAPNRAIFEIITENMGWVPASADSGATALAMCASGGPFDLILMDYRMPGMNGCEATRAIRNLGGWAARTPILGVTADYSDALRNECLKAGMTKCVAKPINLQAFSDLMVRMTEDENATHAAPAKTFGRNAATAAS